MSNYKCPKCGKPIEKQFTGLMTTSNIVSCENFCFENIEDKYLDCPICEEGKMTKVVYHGSEYKKCDNEDCEFELSVDKVITLALEK